MTFSQTVFADTGADINYSKFCELVTESMGKYSDADKRHEYIVNNLENRVSNKNIRDGLNAIFQVDPKERYQVFKQGVEVETGKKWECVELKKYFDQYVSKNNQK